MVTALSLFSLYLSVVHAYDVSLRASKKREQELQEQLNAAQRDSQEKDQKCSKLEDAMYDMQKKMTVSRDDYEQQQELLVKLQQKSKYRLWEELVCMCSDSAVLIVCLYSCTG